MGSGYQPMSELHGDARKVELDRDREVYEMDDTMPARRAIRRRALSRGEKRQQSCRMTTFNAICTYMSHHIFYTHRYDRWYRSHYDIVRSNVLLRIRESLAIATLSLTPFTRACSGPINHVHHFPSPALDFSELAMGQYINF